MGMFLAVSPFRHVGVPTLVDAIGVYLDEVSVPRQRRAAGRSFVAPYR